MSENSIAQRRVVNYREADFVTYGLQGEPQADISWHNISWSDTDNSGFFLAKFAPGAVSIPHRHLGWEEFIILEGELTDHDGHVYRQGDCVSLPRGSRHWSSSKTGAIVGVFIRGGFETISEAEV